MIVSLNAGSADCIIPHPHAHSHHIQQAEVRIRKGARFASQEVGKRHRSGYGKYLKLTVVVGLATKVLGTLQRAALLAPGSDSLISTLSFNLVRKSRSSFS